MQRTKRGLRFCGVAVLASAGAVQWAAAQNEPLTVEVGECVDLPTPEQRLACFESRVEAARGGAAGAQAAPEAAAPLSREPAPRAAAPAPRAANTAPASANRSETPAPSASAEVPEEFGFRERRRAEPEPAAVPEVRAKIVELRETVPNAFTITLDNGQVWRQTRPDPYVTLRAGYEVRINMSRFRAYRLTSPDMRGFVQVERVR
jgi:hypothetical protein